MNYLSKHITIIISICISVNAVSGQNLRMNQIQVIGSHNSYKIGIEKPLMELLLSQRPESRGLDYEHLPIKEQLDLGLRSLEIDVVHDPSGGRFARPKGLEMLRERGTEPLPYNGEVMQVPGFKVLHIPDVDFRTHCATFKACLSEIREWSKSHADHLPIIITINPKSEGVEKPGFAKVIPFDEDVFDALDREILDVVGRDHLITPKLVKGKHETLRSAIVTDGWPDLAKARGKILFVLDAGNELTTLYVENDHVFARPMFANVEAESPHAAFFIMNDPVERERDIAERVKQGFMVRTRSDADTKEARTGDKKRFEAAARSGAQVITTDYYLKALSPNKDFEINFDGKYSRCNGLIVKSFDCVLK